MVVSAADVVLSAEGLAKRYGDREVVSDVSFALRRGEVFGFLGPNGAGKTTTIRMLVGLVKPSRGRIVIDGHDLGREFEAARRRVGCMVERPDLYKFLPGRENLEHFARMLGDGAAGRIDTLPTLVHMDGRLDGVVRTYSLGMRQRVGLAPVLARQPPARRHPAAPPVRPRLPQPRRAAERPRPGGHPRDARARAAARW